MIDGQQMQADDLTYAGFWARFVAFIIDIVILQAFAAIVSVFLVTAIWSLAGGDTEHTPQAGQIILPFVAVLFGLLAVIRDFLAAMHMNNFSVCALIASWPYFACMESSRRQATIGKSIMGIKVVTMDGKRLSFWRATGRHFGKFISAVLMMAGFIMAAFTARRQALHDIMAGTLVVRLISPKVVFEGDKA